MRINVSEDPARGNALYFTVLCKEYAAYSIPLLSAFFYLYVARISMHLGFSLCCVCVVCLKPRQERPNASAELDTALYWVDEFVCDCKTLQTRTEGASALFPNRYSVRALSDNDNTNDDTAECITSRAFLLHFPAPNAHDSNK